MKMTWNDIKLLFKLLIVDNAKRFCGVNTYTKAQEKMFKKVKIGSKVVCQMPVRPLDLVRIPQGHRVRPFIIVDKDDDYLYGYLCTTHPNKKLQRHQKQFIETLADGTNRKSYVAVNKLYRIERKEIVGTGKTLSDELLVKINRCILITRRRSKSKKSFRFFDVEMKYEVGDIINDNGSFYCVYQITGDELYTYPVYTQSRNKVVKLNVNSTYKFIDFNKQKIFKGLDINHLHTFYEIKEIEILNKVRSMRKVKEKKVFVKPPRYKLDMPCGTVMKTPWGSEEFMYLFTYKDKTYFTSLDSCEENEFIMFKKKLEYLEKDGEMDELSIIEIVEKLAHNYKAFSAILLDSIKDIKVSCGDRLVDEDHPVDTDNDDFISSVIMGEEIKQVLVS